MTDTAAPDAPDTPALKPFAAFLQEQGNLHDELSHALVELVSACVDTGKKGALTLKITVAPNKDDVTVLVSGDIAVKPPGHDAKPSLFFPDAQGNLLRRDPRQPELPLREVPGGKDRAAARDLRQAGGES